MTTPIHTNCQGLARRDFIQVGLRAGGCMGLASLLQLRAEAARAQGKPSAEIIRFARR